MEDSRDYERRRKEERVRPGLPSCENNQLRVLHSHLLLLDLSRSLELLDQPLLGARDGLVVKVDGVSEGLDILFGELRSGEKLRGEGVGLWNVGNQVVEELDGGGEAEREEKGEEVSDVREKKTLRKRAEDGREGLTQP